MGFFDDGYLGAVVRGVRWIDHQNSYEKEQQLPDFGNIFDLAYCSQPYPLIKSSSSQTQVSEASGSSVVGQRMCNSMLVDDIVAEETDLNDIFLSSLGGSSVFLEEESHSPSTVASSSRGAAKSEAMEVAEQTTGAYKFVHARKFSGELETTSTHAAFIQSVAASEEISTTTWSSPESKTKDISKYSEPTLPLPLKDPDDQPIITAKLQSKRRKGLQKRVVCVPMAGSTGVTPSSDQILPSDMWAWRKYGQKPIKGSPYPRGYYRCSSSKGCSARKQVERSRSDPSMLVITYTSEHNHAWPAYRNSLAGTTRSKYVEKVHATASAESADISKTNLGKEYGMPASPVEGSLSNFETFVLCDDPLHSENPSISSTSHDHHLFQDLEALPELSTYTSRGFLDYRSFENTETIAVDPFELFSSPLLRRE